MKLLLPKLALLATTVTAAALTYDEWRAGHFTETEISDPAISGETADPDGDGRGNYLEFALDTDPKGIQPGSGPLTGLDASGKLTLTFSRWSEHPGLLYAPLVGGGLKSGWFAGSRHLETLSIVVGGDGKETVAVRDLAASPDRFVKLMVATDSDGDGLPDSWELELFSDLDEAGTGDFDIDGLSNLFEWEEGGGRNAADYYNGSAPTLAVASGDGQHGPPDTLVPLPLSVRVSDGSGTPLENAPVTFTVTQGYGELDVIGEVRTDAAGIASVGFYTAPMDDTSTVTASATVVTTGTVVSVTFTETTIAAPWPPEGVDWELGAANTVVVGWTDASATETSFTIEQTIDDGLTWQPAATVGANITQVTLPTPGAAAFAFRAQANNSTGSSKKVLDNSYGSADDDGDGLDNQEEMDEETDKNNPDCDNDLIKDGADASPLDPEITHPRVPRTSYAVIDLTQVGLSAQDDVRRINDRGQILGHGVPTGAFFWDAGVRTVIPVQDTYHMNNHGVITGIVVDPIDYFLSYPVKWSVSSGLVYLPEYLPPLNPDQIAGSSWHWVRGLNDAGTIVGSCGGSFVGLDGSYPQPPNRVSYNCGLRWEQYEVNPIGAVAIWRLSLPPAGQVLEDATGPFVTAADINNAGTIVGDKYEYELNADPGAAFVSEGGGIATLPKSRPNVRAWDINDGADIPGGQTVILGGQSDASVVPQEPTIWVQTANGWKDKYLGRYNPGAGNNALQWGNANWINDRLEMTGWFHDGDYKETGQLWQNGRVRNLKPALLKQGWLLKWVNHINNDGVIVGSAMKVSGPGAGKTIKPVLVVDVKIVPDFNRDGNINNEDRGKVTTAEPWRFWINDDDDSVEVDGDDEVDAPTPDAADEQVKTKRDLLDFFPLYFDIKSLVQVCPPSSYDYFLKQDDSAVNVILCEDLEAESDDTAYNAGSYLRDDYRAGTFIQVAMPAGGNLTSQRVGRLTPDGRKVDPAWLQRALTEERKKTMLLVEGNKETAKPLVLMVKKQGSGEVIAKIEFPLNIKRVKTMYRWINLRHHVGESESDATDLSEPLNWPDKLCSNKVFTFVHGYSVSEKSARDWNAEMFKRMYWSGSKARFVGVTWRGNQGQFTSILPKIGGATPDYWINVKNAFLTSGHLKNELAAISGTKYVAAHSLGNVVVSSAMVDYGLSAGRYFMIDAAVPREAYAPATVASDRWKMREPSWQSIDPSLWSPYFYNLFSTGDARRNLTWTGRFQGISNVYQFYSTGEEVLETNPDGAKPTLLGDVYDGRKAWIAQEMNKVTATKAMVKLLSGTFQIGPWGQNARAGWDTSGDPQPTTLQDKVEHPYFEKFSSLNGVTMHQDNALGAVPAADFGFLSRLLGEEIPALSWPTGSNPVSAFSLKGDLNTQFRKGWPDDRMQPQNPLRNRWLHSDMKNVSYLHVHPLFDEIVKNGDLK